MHIAITGWEGTGKSTLCNSIRDAFGAFLVSEMARIIMPINGQLLQQDNEALSGQTITGYFTAHHMLASNGITRSVQDRCVIDPLTYDTLYNDNKLLTIERLQRQIEDFNKLHNQDFLIDTLVILKHPKKDDFIIEQVFSDKERLYSQSVEQYKADASKFEQIAYEAAHTIKGLCKQVVCLDSYCDNPFVLDDIAKIITSSSLSKVA